jgi:hypothetical protein
MPLSRHARECPPALLLHHHLVLGASCDPQIAIIFLAVYGSCLATYQMIITASSKILPAKNSDVPATAALLYLDSEDRACLGHPACLQIVWFRLFIWGLRSWLARPPNRRETAAADATAQVES